MKNSLAILMALLPILLVQTITFAQSNAQTLGVSCTIPAIPGVNAAPDEKQLIEEQKPAPREMDITIQRENQQEASYVITEDAQEAKTTEQGENSVLVLVKTIYNR
ncbi:hypothetical protein EPN16_07640 [bacterium]|nr:MAG: hypothetical protein EPN16_07640 [bacterium]